MLRKNTEIVNWSVGKSETDNALLIQDSGMCIDGTITIPGGFGKA